jgi:hypothetical protein
MNPKKLICRTEYYFKLGDDVADFFLFYNVDFGVQLFSHSQDEHIIYF